MSCARSWDEVFARIRAEGWSGVEAITLGWREDPDLFCSLLKKHDLKLICQLHTTGAVVARSGTTFPGRTTRNLPEGLPICNVVWVCRRFMD